MNNIITREQSIYIADTCRLLGISTYTTNNDGSINVLGDVEISDKLRDNKLPISFNKVGGDFICNSNDLTTLEGCPTEVLGNFNCSQNKLRSLEFGPKLVGGYYQCQNNQLTSLKYTPGYIKHNFVCTLNHLKTLEDGPDVVEGYFDCDLNNLTSLKGAPKSVGGSFKCADNKLTTLEFCPKKIGYSLVCHSNSLTSLGFVPPDLTSIFYNNNPQLPKEFLNIIKSLDSHKKKIFDKYYFYYNLWNGNDLNIDELNLFYDDIMDGLE